MLPQLRPDWAQHVVYGVAAAVVGAAVAAVFGLPAWAGAFGAALVVGVAKEAHDLITGRGQPSVADIVATAAGSLPAVAAHFLTA